MELVAAVTSAEVRQEGLPDPEMTPMLRLVSLDPVSAGCTGLEYPEESSMGLEALMLLVPALAKAGQAGDDWW